MVPASCQTRPAYLSVVLERLAGIVDSTDLEGLYEEVSGDSDLRAAAIT